MKKNLISLLSSLALVLGACSNESDPLGGSPGGVVPGEPATLDISLGGGQTDGIALQAAGSEGSDESKVNNGIIYVFDLNGNVIKKAFFKPADFPSSPTTKTVTTTTAAKSVSVLLNVGVSDSLSLAGTIYDVPSKTKLEALIVNLAGTNGTGAATQTKSNLYMSGASTGTITFSGSPLSASVPVTVSRIASRVKINWVFQPASTFVGKIRLTGAVVLNARSISKLFGTPLYPATGSQYIQGLSTATLTAFPFSGYKPETVNVISNEAEYAVSSFSQVQNGENHFYIFENAAMYPTIVAIVADYNENGLDSGTSPNVKKYYPIVLNKGTTGGQTGTMMITRNTLYNVTATIHGQGVDNPFDPVDPASLNVVVTVAPWALTMNIGQVFE